MSATRALMELDKTKSVRRDSNGVNTRFSHSDCLDIQDPTGVSNEEGELLYSLVRMIKPNHILETGTNIGVSTSYMALGCLDNGFGHITTIEHLGFVADRAKKKLGESRLLPFVTVLTSEVSAITLNDTVDFIWLDTEFKERYAELDRFFLNLRPGGFIGIHDLCELDNPAYGGVTETMRMRMERGILRAVNFNTTSGVVMFQKSRGNDDSIQKIIGG